MEKILISDAAKQVEVESHVLRYWEEELHLPIQRNKQGHRYYTTEDVNRFKQIKTMKEQGFQLKAIRSALDGSLTGMAAAETVEGRSEEKAEEGVKKTDGQNIPEKPAEVKLAVQAKKAEKKQNGKKNVSVGKAVAAGKERQPAEGAGRVEAQQKPSVEEREVRQEVQENTAVVSVVEKTSLEEQDKAGKAARLQFLLQHMIAEAVRENNEQLCENVKQVVAKEMDFQFRQQEEKEQEREAERLKREEEHFRQIDTLLRGKSRRESRKERRKRAFGLQKQPD